MYCQWFVHLLTRLHVFIRQTSLVSRAIDAFDHPNAREQVQNDLLEYLDTDTIWYSLSYEKRSFIDADLSFYHNEPPPLTALQTEHWDPLIDWARKTFEIEISTFDSILSESQPEETKIKLVQVLADMDNWELAGQLTCLRS